jgi:Flp pilus assembly pilin Flp
MSPSIILARSTSAVESGLRAAGITVAIVAAVQSLFIVLTWVIVGV